jgi:HK97 gp10 family phage protein
MPFEMKVEGYAELKQQLQDLSQKESDRILNRALRAGAAVFQVEEEARAPERPDLPSGTALPPGALRADVEVRKLPGTGRRPIWIIGPGKYTSQAAHLVELGHRIIKGGKNRLKKYGIQVGPGVHDGFVPPHPYIRPAFEAGQQEAMDAIVESMKADISRVQFKGKLKRG